MKFSDGKFSFHTAHFEDKTYAPVVFRVNDNQTLEESAQEQGIINYSKLTLSVHKEIYEWFKEHPSYAVDVIKCDLGV